MSAFGQPEAGLDRDLWLHALARIVAQPPDQANPVMVGAAAGILYGAGRLDDAQLIALAQGYLAGTSTAPDRCCGLLRGLLATAREVAWHVSEIMAAVDEQLGSWEESRFLESLPELRLAFADLTPQETTRVAETVAHLHGEQDLGALVQLDVNEEELQFALILSNRVAQSLQADGLA